MTLFSNEIFRNMLFPNDRFFENANVVLFLVLLKPFGVLTFASMFFKTDIKQKDGRDYRYYRLCESYRDGRRIRNRTLLCVDDLESLLPAEKIGFLSKRINQVYYEGKTFMISFPAGRPGGVPVHGVRRSSA